MRRKSECKRSIPIENLADPADRVNLEAVLKTLPGVSNAAVDVDAGKVNLTYDANQIDLIEFTNAIVGAGFRVPTEQIMLRVKGMNCLSCVGHVKGALEDLPGVLSASVELAQGNAKVVFVSGLVSQAEMIQAVEHVGYLALLEGVVDHLGIASRPEGVDPQQPPMRTGRFERIRRMFMELRR